MKELLKISQAAKKVINAEYVDLEGNRAQGLDNVISAIHGDVETLKK